jgi:hypothetical protein
MDGLEPGSSTPRKEQIAQSLALLVGELTPADEVCKPPLDLLIDLAKDVQLGGHRAPERCDGLATGLNQLVRAAAAGAACCALLGDDLTRISTVTSSPVTLSTT